MKVLWWYHRCVRNGGFKKGNTFRMLRDPDHRHGEQGYPWCHGWSCFTLRKITWKFCVDILLEVGQKFGVKKEGRLEEQSGFLTRCMQDRVVHDGGIVKIDVWFISLCAFPLINSEILRGESKGGNDLFSLLRGGRVSETGWNSLANWKKNVYRSMQPPPS